MALALVNDGPVTILLDTRGAAGRLMARAGFTAIHAGRIRFGKDGRWYCDGEPIANQAICRLYARTMTVDPRRHAPASSSARIAPRWRSRTRPGS